MEHGLRNRFRAVDSPIAIPSCNHIAELILPARDNTRIWDFFVGGRDLAYRNSLTPGRSLFCYIDWLSASESRRYPIGQKSPISDRRRRFSIIIICFRTSYRRLPIRFWVYRSLITWAISGRRLRVQSPLKHLRYFRIPARLLGRDVKILNVRSCVSPLFLAYIGYSRPSRTIRHYRCRFAQKNR